jgi:hypothetical protein
MGGSEKQAKAKTNTGILHFVQNDGPDWLKFAECCGTTIQPQVLRLRLSRWGRERLRSG